MYLKTPHASKNRKNECRFYGITNLKIHLKNPKIPQKSKNQMSFTHGGYGTI
jgi:hypothetical protein